ncbi:MAG: DUF1501 domain-containing protein [Planctomycetota bacterium]|nr:DUF1501 domain-containing protein [Planctomycetota bacterium]
MRRQTIPRRYALQRGLASFLSVGLPSLWRGQAMAVPATTSFTRPPIRACIFIFYYGGPSHIDTYDPKPDAPAEVRGEFKTIATSVPGIRISEHLPHMAQRMHHVALIRSMHHEARLHDSASIHALTGRPLDGPDRELLDPTPQAYPSLGSAVAYELRQDDRLPGAALPFAFRNVHPVPCQGAGFLGADFDPLLIQVDPEKRLYGLGSLALPPDVSVHRRTQRQALLADINTRHWLTGPAIQAQASVLERAQRLFDSKEILEALDLSREPDAVRERYGYEAAAKAVGEGGGARAALGFARQMRGQNLLIARRLVEAGVPFVNVYDFQQQGQNWDAHDDNFDQHKNHLLPLADRSLAALIDDLHERGLLESTLVVATGEFGRTPKINPSAGRDHWPDCYTALLAGGGVTGGTIVGASDRNGAYPASEPVTPGDLAATLYWRFGIDPQAEMRDTLNRPHRLANGQPLVQMF